MAFETVKFEDITVSHLQALVDSGVTENRILEYKAVMYGRDDQGNKEALKDITAFANTDGGHLVIGISEKSGVHALAEGIDSASIDTEIQRLESLLRDAVEPRLIGYQIKSIPMSSNRHAIIVHIPHSWTKPHRTNSKHFYVRNSNGVHEVSVSELRTLFLSSHTEMERIRLFVEDRIGALVTGKGMPLEASNLVVLHMIPVLSFLGNDLIDVKRVKENPGIFPPINSDLNRSRPNLDGFCNFSNAEDGKHKAYTQIFRNGAVEAVLSGIVRDNRDGGPVIDGWVIKNIVASIAQYERALIDIGKQYPFVVVVSLLGAKAAHLWFGADRYHHILPSPIDRHILTLPESILDHPPESEELAAFRLKGTLDALWNAGGEIECTYFDETGKWRPR